MANMLLDSIEDNSVWSWFSGSFRVIPGAFGVDFVVPIMVRVQKGMALLCRLLLSTRSRFTPHEVARGGANPCILYGSLQTGRSSLDVVRDNGR